MSTTGRDFYADIYATQLDDEAKWLAIGAVEKANSVVQLVQPRLPHPQHVLELGAGTGGIIRELQRRGFADHYTAVDYSADACAYLEQHVPGVRVFRADIVTDRIDESADVVVLSHVLEHLERPDQMLQGIADHLDFQWLVVECPLEDLVASRLKNRFRDRLKNPAGHVQFFTAASFKELVGRYFEIVDTRHYCPSVPSSAVEFLAKKDKVTGPKRVVKHFTMNILPRCLGPIWKHVWLGNCALLCRRRPTSSAGV